jgi:threonine dehydrogenase-like Zn-dependent dehydrogenase
MLREWTNSDKCYYCKKKQSSQCEKTNSNTLANGMYGGRTAGMFGYSHFTGGFAGGQAEYVRVPYGDVNLLKLPDNVPDEKGTFTPYIKHLYIQQPYLMVYRSLPL